MMDDQDRYWKERARLRDANTSITTTAEIPTTTTTTIAEKSTTTTDDNTPPGLTFIWRLLAGLEMIGGLTLCAMLWPEVSPGGYLFVNGNLIGKATAVVYVPALTWLFAGLISGLLFWALGDVLRYLRDIHRSLEAATK